MTDPAERLRKIADYAFGEGKTYDDCQRIADEVEALGAKSGRQRRAYRDLQQAYLAQIGVKTQRLTRLRAATAKRFWAELDDDVAMRLMKDAMRIGHLLVTIAKLEAALRDTTSALASALADENVHFSSVFRESIEESVTHARDALKEKNDD